MTTCCCSLSQAIDARSAPDLEGAIFQAEELKYQTPLLAEATALLETIRAEEACLKALVSATDNSDQISLTKARPALFASRSARRALLIPQVNAGSLYHCSRST